MRTRTPSTGCGRELLPPDAGGNSFHRLRAVPLPRGGRSWERERASFFGRGRRGLGATAKPLYAIDGKTGGFDRRGNPVGGDGGRELLPPPAGGPPPSKREVFGEGRRGRGGGTSKFLWEGAKGDRASDARELLPPPAGGPPPSRREGLWGGVQGDEQVSSGGAKGDRGERKAPISNRRQGRRP